MRALAVAFIKAAVAPIRFAHEEGQLHIERVRRAIQPVFPEIGQFVAHVEKRRVAHLLFQLIARGNVKRQRAAWLERRVRAAEESGSRARGREVVYGVAGGQDGVRPAAQLEKRNVLAHERDAALDCRLSLARPRGDFQHVGRLIHAQYANAALGQLYAERRPCHTPHSTR